MTTSMNPTPPTPEQVAAAAATADKTDDVVGEINLGRMSRGHRIMTVLQIALNECNQLTQNQNIVQLKGAIRQAQTITEIEMVRAIAAAGGRSTTVTVPVRRGRRQPDGEPASAVEPVLKDPPPATEA